MCGPLNCPPPLPDGGFEVFTIDSLEAALEKLNIDVSVKDIISVIRELEEAKRAKQLALHPPERSLGLQFTTTSQFVEHPPSPEKADPRAKERRNRLLELTKQRFPDGKVPDPFTLTSPVLAY
ncbi:hypothetical protein BC826DRAFT_1102734 [Russula brevipes]|nr:hypothetical protein BC826DRAFT_1102734 [Russula brevipes]